MLRQSWRQTIELILEEDEEEHGELGSAPSVTDTDSSVCPLCEVVHAGGHWYSCRCSHCGPPVVLYDEGA